MPVDTDESAVTDEGCGYAGEGKEMFCLAFVAAVESAAAGEPGNGPLNNPSVAAGRCEDSIPLRAMRWRIQRLRSHRRRWS